MNERYQIHRSGSVFMGYLRHRCVEDLRWMLDPARPWIWLPSYSDAPFNRWTTARLPLPGASMDVEARFQSVDLLLPTAAFLDRLLTSALELKPVFQMTRKVPNTLHFHTLSTSNLYPVLIENGLYLHVELSYDDEIFLAAPERETLERIWQAAPKD